MRYNNINLSTYQGFPDSSVGKESICNAGDLGSIPELGRSPAEGKGDPLQYSGLENPMNYIVHGVATSRIWLSAFSFTFHFSLSRIGEGNGNPLQCSCLENPRDGGAWWASVYGVTQSRTRLKRLSSSSSSKESTCNAGDLGLIPALGRSPGEWKDYPLQYSGLENSMDNILHGVAESDMTEPLSLASFCIVNSCMFHVSWEVGRS